MSAATQPRLCHLEQAIGRAAACPEEHCPFWEPGGAVLEGRCLFEGIDVARDPDLAPWLLAIRGRVETSARESDE
jgi:hypothetical protein